MALTFCIMTIWVNDKIKTQTSKSGFFDICETDKAHLEWPNNANS